MAEPRTPAATALIIIDLQQGMLADGAPKHDLGGLIARLNHLANRVRAADGIVIVIQHDGRPGDPSHPDHPGWQLLPELEVQAGDQIIRKTACDAFLHTGLEKLLQRSGVARLIIAGWATDYCVDTTVRSALARGYATVVPSDGHTVSDRPHLPATKIIAHHNAIWADFIAPGGPALVCPCAAVAV
jgi:nicotinamidase-related amidase